MPIHSRTFTIYPPVRAALFALSVLVAVPEVASSQPQDKSNTAAPPGTAMSAPTLILERTIVPGKDSLWAVAFMPGGHRFAVGGGGKGTGVGLWDCSTGSRVKEFKEPGENFDRYGLNPYSLASSPDGHVLAAGVWELIMTWDVDSGSELHRLSSLPGFVGSLAYSSDGQHLAAALSGLPDSPGLVAKWDVKEWHVQSVSPGGGGRSGNVTSIAFSPDKQYIAFGSCAKEVKLWYLSLLNANISGKAIFRDFIGHTGTFCCIHTVAFSPDGKNLASGSTDKTVRIWDVNTGHAVYTLVGHKGAIRTVAFSPDGRYLASGSDDKTVKIWNLATGREAQTLDGHKGNVNAVAFSPDGRYLVSASLDKSVRIWRWQE